ncbi:MAG TPA: phosphatase PAP2 family protein [Nocardioides sp.]|nr:phosphatase PAP2 family protein [Nocardioides sp.]
MESQAVDSRAGVGEGGRGTGVGVSRRAAGRSLVLLAGFVLVAVSAELGWWEGVDESVNDWAAAHRVDALWNAAKTVFDVATPETALPITLAIGVLVAWRRRRVWIAVDAAVRVGLVVASVLVLKPVLAIPGPTRNSLGGHGGSFPSGHTTSTLVCVALLLAWAGWPRSATGRAAVNAVVLAVVGGTVIYLQYHYLSDVVGGVVLGLLIATVPLPAPGRRSRYGSG